MSDLGDFHSILKISKGLSHTWQNVYITVYYVTTTYLSWPSSPNNSMQMGYTAKDVLFVV